MGEQTALRGFVLNGVHQLPALHCTTYGPTTTGKRAAAAASLSPLPTAWADEPKWDLCMAHIIQGLELHSVACQTFRGAEDSALHAFCMHTILT